MNKYDEQIVKLTANPGQIASEWSFAIGLFKMVGNKGAAGCLTMIRTDPEGWKALINNKIDEKLTQEIANDERIPKDSSDITIESLPVFKEWQEKIDALQEA